MILFKDMNFISHTSELKNKTCMQYYVLTKTSTAQSIIYEYANSTHMAYSIFTVQEICHLVQL